MNNLWILAEERPKSSVIKQIINIYQKDFDKSVDFISKIKIKPIILNNFFQFVYEVEGLKIKDIEKINIKIVSGNSSFLDFLVFEQENQPIEGDQTNKLIMAIEETKTNDNESRNTSVYQRGSKFVYFRTYYKKVNLYMLYNNESQTDNTKKPSDTNVFGTRLLLTLGVQIIGREKMTGIEKFSSYHELIETKNKIKKPPKTNIPIDIKIEQNSIYISGRLSKPSKKGNIDYDPNIGVLTTISACLRDLGWTREIIITSHNVDQGYIDKTKGNKFLYIAEKLNIKLENIKFNKEYIKPITYWKYEINSEKLVGIFVHIQAIYMSLTTIYENHASCERSYFRVQQNQFIALPKKDSNDEILHLPDLVLFHEKELEIFLIEEKKYEYRKIAIEQLNTYNSIETEYINLHYPQINVNRCVVLYGNKKINIDDDKILLHLTKSGEFKININAPSNFKNIFK